MIHNDNLFSFLIDCKHFFLENILNFFIFIDGKNQLISALDIYDIEKNEIILGKFSAFPKKWYIVNEDCSISFSAESPIQLSLHGVITTICNAYLAFLLSKALNNFSMKLNKEVFSSENYLGDKQIKISGKKKTYDATMFSVSRQFFVLFSEECFFYLFNSSYYTTIKQLTLQDKDAWFDSFLFNKLSKDSLSILKNLETNQIELFSVFQLFLKKKSHKELFNWMFDLISLDLEWIEKNNILVLKNPFFSAHLDKTGVEGRELKNKLADLSSKKFTKNEFILKQYSNSSDFYQKLFFYLNQQLCIQDESY